MAEYDEEVRAVAAVIGHPAAFCVDLYGMMQVYRLEDGSYVVYEEDAPDAKFESPEAAAWHFIKRRHERVLGFDLERAGRTEDH